MNTIPPFVVEEPTPTPPPMVDPSRTTTVEMSPELARALAEASMEIE